MPPKKKQQKKPTKKPAKKTKSQNQGNFFKVKKCRDPAPFGLLYYKSIGSWIPDETTDCRL